MFGSSLHPLARAAPVFPFRSWVITLHVSADHEEGEGSLSERLRHCVSRNITEYEHMYDETSTFYRQCSVSDKKKTLEEEPVVHASEVEIP